MRRFGVVVIQAALIGIVVASGWALLDYIFAHPAPDYFLIACACACGYAIGVA